MALMLHQPYSQLPIYYSLILQQNNSSSASVSANHRKETHTHTHHRQQKGGEDLQMRL